MTKTPAEKATIAARRLNIRTGVKSGAKAKGG